MTAFLLQQGILWTTTQYSLGLFFAAAVLLEGFAVALVMLQSNAGDFFVPFCKA